MKKKMQIFLSVILLLLIGTGVAWWIFRPRFNENFRGKWVMDFETTRRENPYYREMSEETFNAFQKQHKDWRLDISAGGISHIDTGPWNILKISESTPERITLEARNIPGSLVLIQCHIIAPGQMEVNNKIVLPDKPLERTFYLRKVE